MSDTYDRDFYAWAIKQAALLRTGRFAEADVQQRAEEIETLGRGEKRELVNRLAVLLLHVLKWAYEPERRGKSWRLTIEEQRRQISRHLRDNPSLRASQDEAMADAYGDAVLRAERETDLPATCFLGPAPIASSRSWMMDSGRGRYDLVQRPCQVFAPPYPAP